MNRGIRRVFHAVRRYRRAMGALCLYACATTGAEGSPDRSADPGPMLPSAKEESIEVSGALLAPMPVAVTSFGAAALDGYLYVLGGYHGTPHNYTREGQSKTLSRLAADGTGAWEQVSEIEAGLQGFPLVAHEGKLCRFGGTRIENAAGEPTRMGSIDEAACFSPAEGAWEALPSLPAARSSHEAAVVGDAVYLAGGWRLGEAGPGAATFADDVLVWRVGEPAWRRVPAPFLRRAVGVASAGGRLVVLGGLTPEQEVSPRVDVLDPETEAWERGPDFPANAFGVAAVGVGDAVYASARDGVVYRWRLGEAAWTAVASLAFNRFFHQLLPAKGGLVAVGGISGMHTAGRTRHVERVALLPAPAQLAAWSQHFGARAKPSPPSGRCRVSKRSPPRSPARGAPSRARCIKDTPTLWAACATASSWSTTASASRSKRRPTSPSLARSARAWGPHSSRCGAASTLSAVRCARSKAHRRGLRRGSCPPGLSRSTTRAKRPGACSSTTYPSTPVKPISSAFASDSCCFRPIAKPPGWR